MWYQQQLSCFLLVLISFPSKENPYWTKVLNRKDQWNKVLDNNRSDSSLITGHRSSDSTSLQAVHLFLD